MGELHLTNPSFQKTTGLLLVLNALENQAEFFLEQIGCAQLVVSIQDAEELLFLFRRQLSKLQQLDSRVRN